MGFQPTAMGRGLWAKLRADRPEARRVVHLGQMRNLMRGDVIKDFGGRHYQTPGKHQMPFRRTTAPSAARVAQGQARRGSSQNIRVFGHRGCQALSRQCCQQRFDPRAFPWTWGHFDLAVHKPRRTATRLNHTPRHTANRHGLPNPGIAHAGCRSEMAAHPILPLAQEGKCLLFRRPDGQTQANPPIRSRHPQGITLRPRVSAQLNGDRGITGQNVG